jgi:hypothetical protein
MTAVGNSQEELLVLVGQCACVTAGFFIRQIDVFGFPHLDVIEIVLGT